MLGRLGISDRLLENSAKTKMSHGGLGRRPRILYLDAYDSFANNIIDQVEQTIQVEVVKCSIDANFDFVSAEQSGKVAVGSDNTSDPDIDPKPSHDRTTSNFLKYLKNFDAVIAGPGPGWAKSDKDVGLMKELWKVQGDDLLPVLGICLGFQSMCLAFGADIQRLGEPRHGLVSDILHNGKSMFHGVGQLCATQYHSLQVMIEHRMQTKKAVRYPGELWESTETCPKLEPLAWDFGSKRNGAVLMAARHVEKPFWGVQFHPESICTNDEGARIIQNWWNEAQMFVNSRSTSNEARRGRTSLLSINASKHDADGIDGLDDFTPKDLVSLIANGDGESCPSQPPTTVHSATTGSGRLTVSDIVENFDIPRTEAIVLESGLQPDLIPSAVGTGRYSIIGLVIPGETIRIHYYAGSRTIQLRDGHDKVYREWQTLDFWKWIKEFMSHLHRMLRQPPTTPTWAPFWGGLMGYASYEAGLQTIGVDSDEKADCPDVCFAYITRSIVVDHQLKKIYVQSIRGEEDQVWVRDTWERMYEAVGRKSRETTPSGTPMPKSNPFEQQESTLSRYISSCERVVADKQEYCASVSACQERIADGQSYELCLTTANKIRARKPRLCRLSKSENNELSWKLYKQLTSQNPAPFSAYMRMHSLHILSSSPERYISWDRSQTAQCRPIKGTVAKQPGVGAADAHAILSSSKERAENLMIVDLVRHQLHGVYGSGNVHVKQLMEIEEYKTLWQLVSVIDAVPNGSQKRKTPDGWEEPTDYVSASKSTSSDVPYLGFDAFVQSLPPGSMTGAPKKRSCELLQEVEGSQRRGIYSGVMGYLDIGGGGDFSVIIRTAHKIEDPSYSSNSSTEDIWTIGAGGAITAQSVPESEYDEMLGKFQSTARAFIPSKQPPAISNYPCLTKEDVLRGASEAVDSHWITVRNGELIMTERLPSVQELLDRIRMRFDGTEEWADS